MREGVPVQGDATRRLRELVVLYGQRDKVLKASEEERIVETAVNQYGFTVGAARALVIATAAARGIEIESDYQDAANAMVVALSGESKSIGEADFALVARYYASKSQLPVEEAKRRLKQQMEKIGILPAPSGVFFSRRWFRSI